MLVHAKSVMDIESLISKDIIEATTVARNAVKDSYMDACEACGAKRPLPSWIKGGIDTIASKTTKELRQRYYYCYYWPTLHDHATVNNIIERLEVSETDNLKWKEEAQLGWVEVAASSAHGLLVDVLDLNNARFGLGLDEQVKALEAGWRRAWLKEASAGQSE
jgi:hypothetical protein